ncbi:MAG: hypothetical protein J5746_10770, partial [Victivallales bacterium]|nr:hypothetical protein [Victivallales bacterium]
EDAKRIVRIGGFGLEQFDFLASGIGGNVPGDAYAIRDFAPIFYKRPKISLGEGVRANARPDLHAARPKMTSDIKELSAQLDKCASDKEHAIAYLDLNKGRAALTTQVEWLQPAAPALKLKWAENALDTLEIKHEKPYADYRLATTKLLLNGIALPLELAKNRDDSTYAVARIPRTEKAVDEFMKGKLECELRVNAENFRHFSLDTADKSRKNGPPTLMKLDGMAKMWLGFEGDGIPPQLVKNAPPRMTLLDGDEQVGRYVKISNVPGSGNLNSRYNLKYSVAEYPLFFFKYNADDMCNVSLILSNKLPMGNYIRLASQGNNLSRSVRFGKPFVQDGAWHQWLGFVADAFINKPFRMDRYIMDDILIGSGRGIDQTGLYSNLKLDDITVAPAVRSAEQLKFTPHYFDFDGVDYVEYAIFHDAVIYEGQEIKQWKRHKPGEEITPELPASIKDGVAHILLRAADRTGKVSPITDLPFLLDRAKPAVSASIIDFKMPQCNGKALKLNIGISGGAPWCIEDTVFMCDSKKIKPQYWSNEYDRSI